MFIEASFHQHVLLMDGNLLEDMLAVQPAR